MNQIKVVIFTSYQLLNRTVKQSTQARFISKFFTSNLTLIKLKLKPISLTTITFREGIETERNVRNFLNRMKG